MVRRPRPCSRQNSGGLRASSSAFVQQQPVCACWCDGVHYQRAKISSSIVAGGQQLWQSGDDGCSSSSTVQRSSSGMRCAAAATRWRRSKRPLVRSNSSGGVDHDGDSCCAVRMCGGRRGCSALMAMAPDDRPQLWVASAAVQQHSRSTRRVHQQPSARSRQQSSKKSRAATAPTQQASRGAGRMSRRRRRRCQQPQNELTPSSTHTITT